MKLFNLINIGERAGSGVPDIFITWGKEGWELPTIEESYGPDRTKLTLSFQKPTIKTDDKKATIKSDDKKFVRKTQLQIEKIKAYLKSDKEYRLQEFSSLLGTKETRTKEIVKVLVESDVLESIGHNRNRRYRLWRKSK